MSNQGAVLYGEQGASDVLDWSIDWTQWLEADAIASSLWTAEAGINIDDPLVVDGVAIVWVSGGQPGRAYKLTNQITTESGRVSERSIQVTISDA